MKMVFRNSIKLLTTNWTYSMLNFHWHCQGKMNKTYKYVEAISHPLYQGRRVYLFVTHSCELNEKKHRLYKAVNFLSPYSQKTRFTHDTHSHNTSFNIKVSVCAHLHTKKDKHTSNLWMEQRHHEESHSS